MYRKNLYRFYLTDVITRDTNDLSVFGTVFAVPVYFFFEKGETMAAIKDLTASSDKWVRRASVSGPDYVKGIQDPRRGWEDATVKAEASYRQAVVQAANQGRFSKGVKNAGEEKWKSNALAKGPGRFAEGVAVAKKDWEKGFKPFRDAIEAIDLPARGPKGSAQNIQRVTAIAQALRQLKERI